MIKPKTRIKATFNGPYVVEGMAPIQEQTIEKDPATQGWIYSKGKRLKTAQENVKLCRCGHSSRMPFCDESHRCQHFDGT